MPSRTAFLAASNIGTLVLKLQGFVSAATNTAAASDRLRISDLRAGIAYKIGGPSDTIKF
jgi:hypothetical protein